MIGRIKCKMCENFLGGDFLPDSWKCKCKAFPDGIPEMKIAYISHDPCIDCNNGIGFKRAEEKKK